jgi:hypothetical protein
MERPATLLPALMDEEHMIDLVAEKERSVPQWDADKGREWLGAALRKRLLEGRLSAALNAIKAADAGDEICDTTLRSVYAEIPDKVLLDERETAYLHIRAYGKRAVLCAPHKRQGHRWHDNWMQNISLCALIVWAYQTLGVRPTRNRVQYERARQGQAGILPSGVSLVVAARARNKRSPPLDEWSVQQHIWLGETGALVRSALDE